jgi:ABC-2 type transport system permease protein
MSLAYLALEVRRTFRNRRFLIFTLGFPVVFFLVFTAMYAKGPDAAAATRSLMISMTVFGCLGAVLNSGARIAAERAVGWNRVLRLTPLNPRAYLGGKLLVALLLALAPAVVVFGCAHFLHGVNLGAAQWVEMLGALLLGLVPFAVIGVALGYLATPESTQAITGASIMLLSLFGGVWIPIEVMPHTMANFAQAIPSYWLTVAVRSPLPGQPGVSFEGVAVLIAWTLGVAAFALRRYRKDAARG